MEDHPPHSREEVGQGMQNRENVQAQGRTTLWSVLGDWSIPTAEALARNPDYSDEDPESSQLSFRAIASGLLHAARQLCRAREGAIVILGPDLELLITGAEDEPVRVSLLGSRNGPEPAPAEDLTLRVLQSGEPLLLPGAATVVRWAQRLEEVQGAIGVPLHLGGTDVGVLWVSGRRGPTPFGDSDLIRLQTLAVPCATALAIALRWTQAVEAGLLAERRRLAQRIHDGPVQEMSAVALQMEIAQRLLDVNPEKVPGRLALAKEQSRRGVQQLRQFMSELRSSDVQGMQLAGLLDGVVARFANETGLKASFEPRAWRVEVSPRMRGMLAAIVQEALSNVGRHAQAKSARVILEETEGILKVTVEDDGQGFDLEEARRSWGAGRFGLLGISERARTLGGGVEIDTAPGRGTRLTVICPHEGWVDPEALERAEARRS